MSQGLGVSVHSTTVGVRPRSQLELVRSRKVRKYSVRVNGAGSVDYGTEDEDIRLIREFESLKNKVDPQNNVRRAAHLELLWSMSERKRPEQCDCCHGSGERECLWCHGTGAMTVGDTLFCTNEGCRPCPVCRGGGSCKCEACRGTGKRAAWMAKGSCPR